MGGSSIEMSFKVPEKIYFEAGSIQYLEKMPDITRAFIVSCLHSLGRVGLGIVIAIVLGFLTALLSSFSNILYEVLYPFVTVIKSTPVASFIILIWI